MAISLSLEIHPREIQISKEVEKSNFYSINSKTHIKMKKIITFVALWVFTTMTITI